MERLAFCFFQSEQFETSAKLYQKYIGLISADSDTLLYIEALKNLGKSFENLSRYDEAQKQYDRANELKIAKLGKTHPDYIESLCKLANTYCQNNQTNQEALEIYGEYRNLADTVPQKQDISYVVQLLQIARLVRKSGTNNNAAVRFYSECMRILEQKDLTKSEQYRQIDSELTQTTMSSSTTTKTSSTTTTTSTTNTAITTTTTPISRNTKHPKTTTTPLKTPTKTFLISPKSEQQQQQPEEPNELKSNRWTEDDSKLMMKFLLPDFSWSTSYFEKF